LIERLFSRNPALKNHLNAPLLPEREQYLMCLLHQGSSEKRVRQISATLLHVIRLMNLSSLRLVDSVEIAEAGELWSADLSSPPRRSEWRRSATEFRRAAKHWFQYHHSLISTAEVAPPYGETLSQYAPYANLTLSSSTARLYFRWASLFLTMTNDFQPRLSQLSTIDLDRFIDSKRHAGYKPRSLVSVCGALRHFLKFTESCGWTPAGLSMTVKSPRILRYSQRTKGPHWRDVRRLLNGCGSGRADIRARAMMSLCAIYALRASEVANLRLTDLNWVDETFSVNRTKSRTAQRFPLQFEVGEAILRYLQGCRPQCTSKLLFVTLSPPYRRVCVDSIGDIVRDRMRRLNVQAPSLGAHSLRHACATELLRKGVSLEAIADFLGHQDLSSVSVYAKCSPRALKDVAAVDLLGLL
jgi:integrase/recombinase XerD